MKFKLKHKELLAFIELFAKQINIMNSALARVNNDDVAKVGGKLALELFKEMHLMFRTKELQVKEKYTLKFSQAQAISFWMYFNDGADNSSGMGNDVQMLCNAIHQQIISK